MMLQQAMEQRDCGDISKQQYQTKAKKIHMLTEQEQIREVREHDRQQQQQQEQQQQHPRPLQPPFKGENGSGPCIWPPSIMEGIIRTLLLQSITVLNVAVQLFYSSLTHFPQKHNTVRLFYFNLPVF